MAFCLRYRHSVLLEETATASLGAHAVRLLLSEADLQARLVEMLRSRLRDAGELEATYSSSPVRLAPDDGISKSKRPYFEGIRERAEATDP